MLNICFYVFIGCHSLLRTVCSVCLPICWLDNLLLWLKLSHILDNEASVRCMACKVLLFCCCHFQCGCSLIWCSPICQLPRIKTESSSQWMQKMAFRKVSLSSRLKTRESGHSYCSSEWKKQNRTNPRHLSGWGAGTGRSASEDRKDEGVCTHGSFNTWNFSQNSCEEKERGVNREKSNYPWLQMTGVCC